MRDTTEYSYRLREWRTPPRRSPPNIHGREPLASLTAAALYMAGGVNGLAREAGGEKRAKPAGTPRVTRRSHSTSQ